MLYTAIQWSIPLQILTLQRPHNLSSYEFYTHYGQKVYLPSQLSDTMSFKFPTASSTWSGQGFKSHLAAITSLRRNTFLFSINSNRQPRPIISVKRALHPRWLGTAQEDSSCGQTWRPSAMAKLSECMDQFLCCFSCCAGCVCKGTRREESVDAVLWALAPITQRWCCRNNLPAPRSGSARVYFQQRVHVFKHGWPGVIVAEGEDEALRFWRGPGQRVIWSLLR